MVELYVSTSILFSELLVSISILYSFYSGYKNNKFPFTLVAITLSYETLVNVSYMVYRVISGGNPGKASGFDLGLAIFHGTFSLIMFVTLLIFMFLAWINYKKGINYFLEHKRFTILFIIMWLIAVASGILFYYVSYFT